MRKSFLTSLLIFGMAGVQYLFAQTEAESRRIAEAEKLEEPKLTLSVKPYVDHDFALNLNKLERDKDTGKVQDAFKQKDGLSGAKFHFNYGNLASVLLDVRHEIGHEGGFAKIIGQTYFDVHALDALFGADRKVFDAYIKAGLFDAGLDNGKHAGQDTWLADVDSLNFHQGISDNQTLAQGNRSVPNLQLSLKILDMLTLSGVFRLDDWHNIPFKQEHAKAGTTFANLTVSHNTVTDPQVIYDFGVALLFEETFADAHKIEASVGYLADFSPEKDILAVSVPESTFDQLGITLAYTGTFGNIQLMPFANFRVKNVLAKGQLTLDGFIYDWSAGVKLSMKNKVKLVEAGVDVGGAGCTGEKRQKTSKLAVFQGLGVSISTDILRNVMGERFLAPYLKARFEFDSAEDLGIVRSGVLELVELGFNQYLINNGKNTIKLFAGYQLGAADSADGKVLAQKTEHSVLFGIDAAFDLDINLK